jgi:hypothetical protein
LTAMHKAHDSFEALTDWLCDAAPNGPI